MSAAVKIEIRNESFRTSSTTPMGTKRAVTQYKVGLLELAYKWGDKIQSGGAKDMNFEQKPLFWSNFGETSSKVGGEGAAASLAHPIPTAL